jgi:hypothetical protein
MHAPGQNLSNNPKYVKERRAYTPKKKSSGVDNWYLDEFFEEFIYGR